MERITYPLSLAQQNIYSQETVAAGTDVNVLFFVLKTKEPLDAPCMEQAVNRFLQENDGPRTRITLRDGKPVQYIEPYSFTPVRVSDLRSMAWEEQEDVFRSWGHAPFVFMDAPLVEFRVVRLNQQEDGLFCKFHHIWCDGWATGLLWSEIFTNYLSLRKGVTPTHDHPSPVEFLEAEQAWLDASGEADRAFWRDYLKDLELGESGLTPGADRSATRRVFHMDPELSDGIRAFAKEQGFPPFVVFTAALCLYHYRRNDCKDVIMGMPRLNRDTERERDTTGMFVMELPLRCTPRAEESFLELCREIAAGAKIAAAHKKFPLTRIMEDLSQDQELGRSLMDASVSYQKTRIDTGGEPFPIEVWFGDPAFMMGSLTMHVLDLFAGGGYTVFYDYRKALYDSLGIRWLHGSLLQLLEQCVAHPERPLSEAAAVAPEEERFLERMGSLEPQPNPPEETVTDLFRAQAEATPDRPAVQGADGSMTYRELDLCSNAIGNALLERGASPDQLTAVMLPRDCRVMASALGILKAGQGFLWLDPSYPAERIAFLLEDSGAACVVTQEEYRDRLPEGAGVLLYGDAVKAPQTPPKAAPKPENLCYSIYTSGTTGKPKGVLIEHRGLANLARPDSCSLVSAVAGQGRRVLAIGSFSFDISILETFIPLLNGVAVSFATEEELENPAALGRRMSVDQVNVLFATPSRLVSYLEYEDFRQAAAKLDVVMSGGEAFQPQLWERLRSLSGSLRIFNAYGPTESSIVTTVQEASGPAVNLGVPVKNLSLAVLGRQGQLLPMGAPGELCIGGIGLARGYRNLPDATAKQFITRQGRRLYRTGDLVRWTREGELLYLGRMDHQVKLRGFRIELGEIESVLSSMEGISSCCVLLKEDERTQYLCGYFTADREIPPQELKDYLGKTLPYYMVPSAFLQLEEMPVTSGGKTDRKALAALETSPQAEYRAPENYMEEQLCAIMARLLGKERIGTEDNFFESGGDSLMAAHLAVEAEAAGIPLKYAGIFNHPTVRGMCAGLESSEGVWERPEIAAYDYTALEPLLTWKEDCTFGAMPERILLTGATGYLGLHVLRELIETSESKIFCVVRPKGKLTAEQRLKNMLFYYFDSSYDDLFGVRLYVLEGDLTQPDILNGNDLNFHLAINCAADVSHFTYGEGMYQINVAGVRSLVELCLSRNAALIHVSTPTVGQFGLRGRTEEKEVLTEEDFYFRQDLSNDYAASKFLGEREVLSGVLRGLHAHILRVGNLQGRFSDGEFQINHAANAFTGRLKAYIRLGFAPASVWHDSVDYSPVDCTAQLICRFARAQTEQVIFHTFNDKRTPYETVFAGLKELGYEIECLEDGEYQRRIQEILAHPEKRELLVDIISELEGSSEGHFEIGYICQKTSGLLSRCGFQWPEISPEYLVTCLTSLDQLGAFGL